MRANSFFAALLALVSVDLRPGHAADLPLRPTLDAVSGEANEPAPSLFVHAGPSGLILDEGARIKAAGAVVPGATIRIPSQLTGSLEAGYFVTPNWAVAVALGVPPVATIKGAGTIAGLGTLGSILYGPTAATVQYHFGSFGPIQPYVGFGPMGMFVFDEADGALSRLRVDPAVGFVGQIGADVMLSRHWGVFVDLKKGYLRTVAHGALGAVPISAQVRLDPLVLSGGATYRF